VGFHSNLYLKLGLVTAKIKAKVKTGWGKIKKRRRK